VLGVHFECVPPVGERALRVAQAGLRLSPHRDQHRIVGRDPKTVLDDRERLLEGAYREVGGREEAVLTCLARRSGEPPLVRRHRQFLLLERGASRDQLIVRLVVPGLELDRLLVELDRAPQLATGMAFQQVAVVVEHARAGPLVQRSLVQRLRRQEVALVAERLVSFEQFVRLHRSRLSWSKSRFRRSAPPTRRRTGTNPPTDGPREPVR
jgi:hypothetical protein